MLEQPAPGGPPAPQPVQALVFRQRLHDVHATCPVRPLRSWATRSGSRISGRARATKSASPVARVIVSMVWTRRRPPTRIKTVCTRRRTRLRPGQEVGLGGGRGRATRCRSRSSTLRRGPTATYWCAESVAARITLHEISRPSRPGSTRRSARSHATPRARGRRARRRRRRASSSPATRPARRPRTALHDLDREAVARLRPTRPTRQSAGW